MTGAAGNCSLVLSHRGLGHNIFIGWLLKTLYILLICIIIGIILLVLIINSKVLSYDVYWTLNYINIKIIGAFLIGLFLSNGVHIITDKIYKYI